MISTCSVAIQQRASSPGVSPRRMMCSAVRSLSDGIDTEFAGCLGHDLTLGPKGQAGAQPAVATVKQERIWSTCAKKLHDGRDVSIATGRPVGSRQVLEELVGVRMGPQGLRHHPVVLAEVLTRQIGRAIGVFPHPHVERRLPYVGGQQLGVGVTDLQQAEVAEAWRIVHHARRRFRSTGRGARSRHAAGNGKHLEKFPATGHVCTKGRTIRRSKRNS